MPTTSSTTCASSVEGGHIFREQGSRPGYQRTRYRSVVSPSAETGTSNRVAHAELWVQSCEASSISQSSPIGSFTSTTIGSSFCHGLL